MPANLTPQYFKAEERYKAASSDDEKIAALEEMLRQIPKHKGTEHLQADLKRKLSKLRKAASSGKKSSSKGGVDIFHVPPQGAGQLVLIGTPNSGKSSIVGAVSKGKVNITDYPFATDKPVPGMMYHEDVQIQIVDMPPITREFATPGQIQTYRNSDLIGIVIDLAGEVLEQMEICCEYLDEHRLMAQEAGEGDESGNRLGRKTFVICTKADIEPSGTLETLQELCEQPFEYVRICPETKEGIDEFTAKVFEMLDVVRVYAKKPGKDPDMSDPFTLPRGSTVEDLATLIHRELGENLQSARAWGQGVYDGQNVQKNHILHDKDIIELHFP